MNWALVAVVLSVVYVSLDLVNFKLIARTFYASFYDKGVTNYYAAAAIYLLYPVAVMVLTRAPNIQTTLRNGAILGATGYGLYHMTNMATMDRWPLDIALYDTAWGVGVTMLLASVSFVLQNNTAGRRKLLDKSSF